MVRHPAIVCLGSGHPEVYTAYNNNNKDQSVTGQSNSKELPEKVNKLDNGLDRLQESMVPHSWILKCLEIVGAYHYHNKQYHGELEDSIDISRNRSWESGYQKRNFPRRLRYRHCCLY